jgi:hypothetical protein
MSKIKVSSDHGAGRPRSRRRPRTGDNTDHLQYEHLDQPLLGFGPTIADPTGWATGHLYSGTEERRCIPGSAGQPVRAGNAETAETTRSRPCRSRQCAARCWWLSCCSSMPCRPARFTHAAGRRGRAVESGTYFLRIRPAPPGFPRFRCDHGHRADWSHWPTGPVKLDGRTASTALGELGPDGIHELAYRVVSGMGTRCPERSP